MKKNENDKNFAPSIGLIGAPFVLVVAPLCGYFFGSWLDKQLNSQPYCAYLFLFFGTAAGIREFYKMIQDFRNDDHSNN